MASIPFIKGDKVDNNVDFRDALPVNYYAVLRNIYGEDGYMLNYYGLSLLGNGEGRSRGSIWVEREEIKGHYRVSGQALLLVNTDGSTDNLGVISGSDQVSMTYSLINLAIVADKKLYYYNKTDGLREITSSVVGDPIDIVWADFKFILTDGEFLYQTTAASEEVFDPVEFSGSDFQPDGIVGVGLNDDNELIAFNKLTTEYFVNIGSENFVYTRIQQKAVKTGLVGTHAKAELSDKWYGLTRRSNTQPQFSIIQSGSSDVISTREIDKLLSNYSDTELSKTVVEVFTKDNITWVLAHLPNLTLAYNETVATSYGVSMAWSILKSDVYGDATYRAKDLTFDPRTSKWCIGDKLNGNIGFLDDSKCTHYGDIVEGLIYTVAIEAPTLSIDELSLKTIPGISPDDDATVFISRTDDLRIFTPEYIAKYGTKFDYNKNFTVRNLGYVRSHTGFKIRTASRSRMAFCRFNIEVS